MQKLLQAIQQLGDNQSVTVGAEKPADLLVSARGVSPLHARFLKRGHELFVQDLDSATGTFKNGSEIRGLVPLASGDSIRIGEFELVYRSKVAGNDAAVPPGLLSDEGAKARQPLKTDTGSRLATAQGGDLVVEELGKAVSGRKRILDGVSFRLRAGQFLGILGASGSGKSTLIRGLAGLSRMSSGLILWQGRLYSSVELQAEPDIAYLPQDVVIHETLTAYRALDFVSRIKGVGRTGRDRHELVEQALARVGLLQRAHVQIDRLSGGQRKRIALAAELLGNPRVLLLDEATSGLDPGTEGEMMELFRSLADEGRIVICITHFPEHLKLCDRLLFLAEGRCCFLGSPAQLLKYFSLQGINDVYSHLKSASAVEWSDRFQRSPLGKREMAVASALISEAPVSEAPAKPESRTARRNWLSQCRLLSSRYLLLLRSDPAHLFLVVIQAPVIALFIGLSYGKPDNSYVQLQAGTTKEILFLLVVSMLWCSGTASVREVVKELPIVRHEVRFGVSLLSYLLSKVLILGCVSLLQAGLLLAGVLYLTDLPGVADFEFVILAATALVGIAQGLAISVVARTSERAMTILPVILIGQAVYSGGLARLEGWTRWLAMAGSPAYWSLDALRAQIPVDLTAATYAGAPGKFQHPILGSGGPMAVDFIALACQFSVFMLIALSALSVTVGRRSKHS